MFVALQQVEAAFRSGPWESARGVSTSGILSVARGRVGHQARADPTGQYRAAVPHSTAAKAVNEVEHFRRWSEASCNHYDHRGSRTRSLYSGGKLL